MPVAEPNSNRFSSEAMDRFANYVEDQERRGELQRGARSPRASEDASVGAGAVPKHPAEQTLDGAHAPPDEDDERGGGAADRRQTPT
jgi:hypothetical protein